MAEEKSPQKISPQEIAPQEIFSHCIQAVIGRLDHPPLGALKVDPNPGDPMRREIAEVFDFLAEDKTPGENSERLQSPSDTDREDGLLNRYKSVWHTLRETFQKFYSSNEQQRPLLERFASLKASEDLEKKAKLVTQIFLPELREEEASILKKWRLSEVSPNPDPIAPTEVLLQLNGLYTLPDNVPVDLPESLRSQWEKMADNPGKKLADYDHPVALFAPDADHELITCLEELEGEMAFEKSVKAIPGDYRFPVLISLSVTHRRLDNLCGDWIQHLLEQHHFQNLRCVLLTETLIEEIKSIFPPLNLPVFSVLGKYATHFNALKYAQLLYEKAYGLKAGFKIDTDEGIRSRDLHAATGKTWLQTLCHNLWGGHAKDHRGKPVYLGINEGEYVNKKDIDNLGYKGAMRTPDVALPKSYLSTDIFFNKGFAHGYCTSLYNRFDHLEDHISHPVVKGGGYGITNEGLRQAVPFTFSRVGRAEDQQFYFCSLAGGCRGIFHPDLRIAHYKSNGGAAAKSEEKTVASRFIGDMYRLVLFAHLIRLLPERYGHPDKSALKEDIDPMPGVFTGKLARVQALLNLLYKAYAFLESGKEDVARQLLESGMEQLTELMEDIDSGRVDESFAKEAGEWKRFIREADALDSKAARDVLDKHSI